MKCGEIQKLIADYSVGLVGGRTRNEIERHLAGCPACSSELERQEKIMLLVEGLEPVEPPVGLWNGVYNRITRAPERLGLWERIRTGYAGRSVGWSVGFATVALAALILFSHVHAPGPEVTYSASEYIQGHAIYASQEPLADQAALYSVVTMAHRDQIRGVEAL